MAVGSGENEQHVRPFQSVKASLHDVVLASFAVAILEVFGLWPVTATLMDARQCTVASPRLLTRRAAAR